jgi:hypothetical protein
MDLVKLQTSVWDECVWSVSRFDRFNPKDKGGSYETGWTRNRPERDKKSFPC